jgi:hypothetical protein
MHVQFAPRRCEAVPVSGSRRGAEGVAREVEPGHCGRIVHVEIVVGGACRDRGRMGFDDSRSERGLQRRLQRVSAVLRQHETGHCHQSEYFERRIVTSSRLACKALRYAYSNDALQPHHSNEISFGTASPSPDCAYHLTYVTLLPLATKDVDPAVVARRESVIGSAGRQGAVEKGVRSTPGWELGLGASDRMQSGESRNAHKKPGQHTHWPPRKKDDLSAGHRPWSTYGRPVRPSRRLIALLLEWVQGWRCKF